MMLDDENPETVLNRSDVLTKWSNVCMVISLWMQALWKMVLLEFAWEEGTDVISSIDEPHRDNK